MIDRNTVLHSLSFFARREDSGAFGGASVHACEPASLPAYLPRAPGAAQSWLENQLANLEVRPTEPPAGLWLRLCRAVESSAASAPVAGPRQASETAGLVCVCAAGFAFSVSYTNHAPVVPALIAQFQFSQAMAGLLTTGIFLTHATMQIPGGHLADRFGSPRVLAGALTIVALANFGIGFASACAHLLWWKIFAGLGTGVCFVSGARYITGLFAGPRTHLAQGLYGGSVLLGSGFVIFAAPASVAAFTAPTSPRTITVT
ncbi:MAG: MFS transporter [Acidobacteria bacterium]|nr:MFS transporter [Acidobacteriota bacterium]